MVLAGMVSSQEIFQFVALVISMWLAPPLLYFIIVRRNSLPNRVPVARIIWPVLGWLIVSPPLIFFVVVILGF